MHTHDALRLTMAALAGMALGAFAAAYLIGWWLSSSRSRPQLDEPDALTESEFAGAAAWWTDPAWSDLAETAYLHPIR